jgi:hypothetical protein
MKCVYKVRHIPSGRFLNGNNSIDALRLTGKPPVGKNWNKYSDALEYSKKWKFMYLVGQETLEVVEYLLTETSSTQVKQ